MPEISIIVPVYNVAQYLHKCVDSILAQTFTDFEVILVDDGATDNSGAICDEYARKDARVRVIHKPNGGLSDARNAGIEASKAPYLGFIDSDDYISREMFQMLHDDITKENADLAICGIYDVYNGKAPKQKPQIRKVLDQQAALEMILKADVVSVHAVNKLYKSEIFSKLRYPVGTITEDAAIIIDVIDRCQRVVVNSKQVYYYFHRTGSISSTAFRPRDLDTINVWEANEATVKLRYPALSAIAHTRNCWAHFIVLDKIMLSDHYREINETAQIVKFLRKNLKFVLKDQQFTKSRKISMLLLAVNIHLYRQVVRWQYRYVVAAN